MGHTPYSSTLSKHSIYFYFLMKTHLNKLLKSLIFQHPSQISTTPSQKSNNSFISEYLYTSKEQKVHVALRATSCLSGHR